MPTASKTYSASSKTPKSLMWPANLVDVYDYMQIDIVEFKPNNTGQVTDAQLDLNFTTPSTGAPLDSFGTLVDNFLPSLIGGVSVGTTVGTLGTIFLPVPEDVSYADAPQWNDQPIGTMGKFGASVAAGVVNSFGGDTGGDVGGLTDSIQQLAQAGSIDMLLKAISATGADPNAVTQNVNGKIANPYVEQVFNGIGMRQFDFSWKLVPRSEGEQENIHNLIKKLREHALPEISGKRWLEVPEIFNIRWMNSGRQLESLPKIKPCVLKSVQVQYTPDNVWATHYKGGKADPYPVAYNLSLSFGETAIITSKDVVKGY